MLVMPNKILVTGATGFVGKRLVRRLLDDGHTVTILTRDVSRAKSFFGDAVSVYEGDITRPETLKGLARRQFSYVFHLAAELNESSPDLWVINVDGTRNLLESIKGKKLNRFIYLSSIGVLGQTNGPAREDMPYNPETKYEESKAEAERIITYFWLKHHIPYTIIRSTIIYGPNRIFAEILKAAKSGYPLIGRGNNRFHLIYVDDVVDALVKAMDPIAENKIYHIAGPDVLTYKDTYTLMCRLMGVKPPDRRVPRPVMLAFATAYEKLARVSSKQPKTTMMSSSIKRLTRDRVVDTSLIRRELGWEPRFSLEEGLKRTISELSRRGLL